MKLLQISLLLTFFATLHALSPLTPAEEDEIFENYLKTNRLRFGRSDNLVEKKKNVIENFKKVTEHNERFAAGLEDFEQELNKFSHLSFEQFSNNYLGEVDQAPSSSVNVTYESLEEIQRNGRANLPENFSWVERGRVVHPVQDQGPCGSCYAFATVGSIESRRCVMFGRCDKVSEQEAMECTNGCGGGSDWVVYEYTQKYGGATSGYTYPYFAKNMNSCSYAARRLRLPNSILTKVVKIPNNEEAIRQALYTKGPLVASFFVYENFGGYKSGIYTRTSGNRGGGHAVLLVGYGVENGIKYWTFKNSWGTWWGDKGYFRTIRGIDIARIEYSGGGMSYPELR